MIEFRINRRSGTPPYLQIVEQVRQALLLGRLRVGDKLPTARDVVATTTINPNTVLKAYRELEHQGLVEGRVGAGTFVTRELAKDAIDLAAPLGLELARWVGRARGIGLARHEVEALVKACLDQAFDPAPDRAVGAGQDDGWSTGSEQSDDVHWSADSRTQNDTGGTGGASHGSETDRSTGTSHSNDTSGTRGAHQRVNPATTTR